MKFPRLITGLVLLFLLASTFIVSANHKHSPFVSAITHVSDGDNPIIEIYGKHFGKDLGKIQVMVNDNGQFAKILYANGEMIQAQLSPTQICAGKAAVRVLVDKKASNTTPIEFTPGTPIID